MGDKNNVSLLVFSELCQVFQQKNLTYSIHMCKTNIMKNRRKKNRLDSAASTAANVREQIEIGGNRIWRFVDFENMPFTAVAKALSRLTRLGIIHRIGKGLYYRPKKTVFGQSKPNTSQLRALHINKKKMFPVGIGAANLLGFSTQNAAKLEVATNGLSLPRLIAGKETIIHTRRPESWLRLSSEDAAMLDFLRKRGVESEFSPHETVGKLLKYFQESDQFERLFQVSESEPPRVRALLGAIGQQIGCSKAKLLILRKSINPLSRFDFGKLIALKYAKQWQAKEHKN